jgi:hypothetical protein
METSSIQDQSVINIMNTNPIKAAVNQMVFSVGPMFDENGTVKGRLVNAPELNYLCLQENTFPDNADVLHYMELNHIVYVGVTQGHSVVRGKELTSIVIDGDANIRLPNSTAKLGSTPALLFERVKRPSSRIPPKYIIAAGKLPLDPEYGKNMFPVQVSITTMEELSRQIERTPTGLRVPVYTSKDAEMTYVIPEEVLYSQSHIISLGTIIHQGGSNTVSKEEDFMVNATTMAVIRAPARIGLSRHEF